MNNIKISDLWNDYRINNNIETTAKIILDRMDLPNNEILKAELINRYEL